MANFVRDGASLGGMRLVMVCLMLNEAVLVAGVGDGSLLVFVQNVICAGERTQ